MSEVTVVQPRVPTGKSARRRERLLARDGSHCCYCSAPLGDDITIEHWVPRQCGGSNDMANMSLAHYACNIASDNLPISFKLKIRDALTAAVRACGGKLPAATVFEIAAKVRKAINA